MMKERSENSLWFRMVTLTWCILLQRIEMNINVEKLSHSARSYSVDLNLTFFVNVKVPSLVSVVQR